MKRLNKKGFTLVELLAAIVILAVLMLVGAQAVGTILNNSNANSLVNSLDMAVKQATMKYAEGTLPTCTDTSNLKDVLTYDDSQYIVAACYSTENHLTVYVQATTTGKFKNTKCNHGNIETLISNAKPIHKDSAEQTFECEEPKAAKTAADGKGTEPAEGIKIRRRVDISNSK